MLVEQKVQTWRKRKAIVLIEIVCVGKIKAIL